MKTYKVAVWNKTAQAWQMKEIQATPVKLEVAGDLELIVHRNLVHPTRWNVTEVTSGSCTANMCRTRKAAIEYTAAMIEKVGLAMTKVCRDKAIKATGRPADLPAWTGPQ